ncbi:RES family NAD+ phosphorylase [Arenimonas malthae]|uniref:RES family NAD+ phosphorylase n=1 Tax=Arenimonas malthae TaxID=354197 RepID=UPI001B805DFF|nr:RES family NAD+ phosphorylase [Arenimonas malthae]
MSPTTWTPTALAAEARPWQGRAWRLVEAQHVVSTMKLVDDVAEQRLLEDLLEAAKPPLPAAAKGLHYLLATPFRYPPLPRGSRFRAAGEPGVFYGADALATACAELGYWRWRFLRDSPALERLDAIAHTAFLASIRTTALDLRAPPFDAEAARWTAPDDYTATQALARVARDAPVGAIRYDSVRDPARGACIALLTPKGFASKSPVGAPQTWWLAVQPRQAVWLRDRERLAFAFG